jgi:uncharacterized iron-regulated protein
MTRAARILPVYAGVSLRKRQLPAIAIAATLGLFQLIACTIVPETPRQQVVHPLQGNIWDVQKGALVSQETLLRELAAAQFILLGEVHDNPEHHRLQADLLRALIVQGRRPALAMEQFDREFQPAIDAALARSNVSAVALATSGEFDRKDWLLPLYAPLLAIAVDARLPVAALNLSRNRTREVARQGFAALGPPARADLALDRS